MSFTDPIIGGQSKLIRTAIQSPNYSAGVAGWTVNKDGSAEFNNLLVRGELIVVGSNGGYIWLHTVAGKPVINLMPQNPRVGETSAVISAENVFLGSAGALTLYSPQMSGKNTAAIEIIGETYNSVTNDSLITMNAVKTQINGDLAMPSAYATFSGNIANNTVTALTPSTMLANNWGIWTAGSSFTIGRDGTYQIGCTFRYATSAVGQRQARIFLNGADLVYEAVDSAAASLAGTNITAQIETVENLVIGDVISFRAFQNSGGNLAVNYGRMWLTQQPI